MPPLHPVGAGPARARLEPALLCGSQRDWTAGVGRGRGWGELAARSCSGSLPCSSLRQVPPSWSPKVQWPRWGPGRRRPPLHPISPPSCLPGGFFFPCQGFGRGGKRVARAPVGRAGSDGGWSCASQAKREAPLSGGGCEEGPQAGSLRGRRGEGGGSRRLLSHLVWAAQGTALWEDVST